MWWHLGLRQEWEFSHQVGWYEQVTCLLEFELPLFLPSNNTEHRVGNMYMHQLGLASSAVLKTNFRCYFRFFLLDACVLSWWEAPGGASTRAEIDDLRNAVLISWLRLNSLSFSSIVSFTTQQDSHQASTPLLLSRHMCLWTTALDSALLRKIFFLSSIPIPSRVIFHKYQNGGSIISIFMKAGLCTLICVHAC